jgi:hypothetical protein
MAAEVFVALHSEVLRVSLADRLGGTTRADRSSETPRRAQRRRALLKQKDALKDSRTAICQAPRRCSGEGLWVCSGAKSSKTETLTDVEAALLISSAHAGYMPILVRGLDLLELVTPTAMRVYNREDQFI